MKLFKFYGLLAMSATFLATSAFAANAEQSSGNPLVGTWEWVNVKNGCKEVYIFANDGSGHITSGEEISQASYVLQPTDKGFYKVTMKITQDQGGKDCSDDFSDSTGQEYTNFLAFHPSGNLYVVCEKESADSCIGPLKRIQ